MPADLKALVAEREGVLPDPLRMHTTQTVVRNLVVYWPPRNREPMWSVGGGHWLKRDELLRAVAPLISDDSSQGDDHV